MKQTENEVKAAIVKYLEIQGYTVYRINNGGVARKRGNRIFYTFHGKKGFADLVAFNPDLKFATVFVETKSTGEKPTPEQREFMDLVNACEGCMAIWADSLDMLRGVMEHNS